MPILLLDVVRAVRALSRDAGFAALGLLLFLSLAGGAVVYWLVEDLGPLDAVYLSVTTLTTVGYGEPAPATAVGKVFTMGFVLVGVGILLAVVGMLAEHVREHSMLRRRLGSRVPADPGPVDFDLVVVVTGEATRRTAVDAATAGLRVLAVDGISDVDVPLQRSGALTAPAGRRRPRHGEMRA
jgi:hypothetical protein